MNRHPTREELLLLESDELPAGECEAVACHVETCVVCQSQIAQSQAIYRAVAIGSCEATAERRLKRVVVAVTAAVASGLAWYLNREK